MCPFVACLHYNFEETGLRAWSSKYELLQTETEQTKQNKTKRVDENTKYVAVGVMLQRLELWEKSNRAVALFLDGKSWKPASFDDLHMFALPGWLPYAR